MTSVLSDGLRVDYLDAGKGEPALLFLPGWCASRGKYTDLADNLAPMARTLLLDWRGHGASDRATQDFGEDALVRDAMAVIARSEAREIVPVATAHAGWVAIELRRRLGHRVSKMILIDWLVLDPPAPFSAALQGLQNSKQWKETRDRLFAMWTEGVTDQRVVRFVREDMGSYEGSMWARAGREISAAYRRHGNPLAALAALVPPVPTLHIYAQPDDRAYLGAQEDFSRNHPWFRAKKLDAKSHFPSIEVPGLVQAAIEEFLSLRKSGDRRHQPSPSHS